MNHMKQVAKILGVEFGGRFDVKFPHSEKIQTYYLNEKGLIWVDSNLDVNCADVLGRILTGEYTVKKEPWKPNCGDYYFTVFPNGSIRELKMVGDHVDIAFYKAGNCYRTKEEAQAHAEEWKVFF